MPASALFVVGMAMSARRWQHRVQKKTRAHPRACARHQQPEKLTVQRLLDGLRLQADLERVKGVPDQRDRDAACSIDRERERNESRERALACAHTFAPTTPTCTNERLTASAGHHVLGDLEDWRLRRRRGGGAGRGHGGQRRADLRGTHRPALVFAAQSSLAGDAARVCEKRDAFSEVARTKTVCCVCERVCVRAHVHFVCEPPQRTLSLSKHTILAQVNPTNTPPSGQSDALNFALLANSRPTTRDPSALKDALLFFAIAIHLASAPSTRLPLCPSATPQDNDNGPPQGRLVDPARRAGRRARAAAAGGLRDALCEHRHCQRRARRGW